MKKASLLILCILLCLLGCTARTVEATQLTTVPAAPEPETTASAVLSAEEQAVFFLENRRIWEREGISDYEPYYVTFTDLDHNGRLEAFTAITQGTGVFTSGAIYEVSEDYTELTEYTTPEGESLPEVILQTTQCYADTESVRYYYAFSDSTRMGAAEGWTALEWLSLQRGELNIETIAWSHLHYNFETGKETEEYADLNGTITAEEFANAYDRAGENMVQSTVYLYWRPAAQFCSAEDVLLSYQVFLGEKKLPRPEENYLEMWIEGMPEGMGARLYKGNGYSIYIPEEDWEHFTAENSGETVEVWWYTHNHDIQMQIVKLAGMSLHQAQDWVRQRDPGYDLTEDQIGGLSGKDQPGERMLDTRIHVADDSAYVISMHYPLEAAEGGGVRLNAMADSFETEE